MIDRRSVLVSMGALALAAGAPAANAAPVSRWPVPPQPRREPRIVGKFGNRRPDDYSWLRPKDWHAVLRDPASLDAGIKSAVLALNEHVIDLYGRVPLGTRVIVTL